MPEDYGAAQIEDSREGERGGDRRTMRHRRFLDRRSGYDRRRNYPITDSLRSDPLRLLALLVILNCLSALDFLFTWMEIRQGAVQEGNPILAHLFAESPGRVWIFKSLLMLAVSLLIWHRRSTRVVISIAIGAFFVYAALVAYHIWVSAALGLG